MKMLEDADLIHAIKQLRKLLSNCDSIRYYNSQLTEDTDLKLYVPDTLDASLKAISSELTLVLTNLEKSNRYKAAVHNLQYRSDRDGIGDEDEDEYQ